MNTESFSKAYNEARNGANEFYHHPLVKKFCYSDGVKDCADAGLYWLLDILATEGVEKIRAADSGLTTVTMSVKGSKAMLKLSGSGDELFWTRKISYTDAPQGVWSFLIADKATHFSMILVSEY